MNMRYGIRRTLRPVLEEYYDNPRHSVRSGSALPHQGRRLVRGRRIGAGPPVPPAGAAHRRNGGVHRHHPA